MTTLVLVEMLPTAPVDEVLDVLVPSHASSVNVSPERIAVT